MVLDNADHDDFDGGAVDDNDDCGNAAAGDDINRPLSDVTSRHVTPRTGDLYLY